MHKFQAVYTFLSNPPESNRKTSFMNFSFVLKSWKFNCAIKWNAILSMDCVHQVLPLDIPYNSVNSECPMYSDLIALHSTSEEEIIPPKSISSVTYTLHETMPDPVRKKTKSPFFLDIEGTTLSLQHSEWIFCNKY